jgi:hypothetical protein
VVVARTRRSTTCLQSSVASPLDCFGCPPARPPYRKNTWSMSVAVLRMNGWRI